RARSARPGGEGTSNADREVGCGLHQDRGAEVSVVTRAGPYHILGGHINRDKQTSNGVVAVPLCNFAAQIVEDVMLDNGVETTRVWMIEGRLCTGEELPSIRVPAQRFASMAWVAEQWGVGAVVHAGQATKDYLREAIQRLSPRAVRRRVYTH